MPAFFFSDSALGISANSGLCIRPLGQSLFFIADARSFRKWDLIGFIFLQDLIQDPTVFPSCKLPVFHK